jgi:hypothetical protein
MSLSVSLSFLFSDLLMMKNTKTAAQIQPSISEPANVSLPLPSVYLLLMKDTKTAAVLTVVIDAKTIEAIAYNIAAMV